VQQTARTIAIAGHSGYKEPVISALASGIQPLKLAAIEAAGRLKLLTDDCLADLLQDQDWSVRVTTLEVLIGPHNPKADWTGSPILTHVTSLLDDPKCAEAAAVALGELANPDCDAVDALSSMASNHEDPLCREAAVASLGSLGAGRAAVLAGLDDIANIRRRATVALSNFDGPDIDQALIRASQDRDPQVRQLAEDLLREV